MDTVFIKDLRVKAVIGIYGWERQVRQQISIDVEMGTDIAKAAASDRIEDTLDYKAISRRIVQFVEQSEPQLVESLIENVAAALREEFSIPWLRITIAKPGAVRGSASVGVTIERGEKDSM